MQNAVIFGFLFLVFKASLLAQAIPIHSTEFSVGLNHIDRNLRLDQKVQIGRHGFHAGIKFHLWRYPYDDQNYIIKHRAYPKTFKEYFGLQAGYSYQFLKLKKGLCLYGFYDIQLSNTTLRIKDYVSVGIVFNPYLYAFGHGYYLYNSVRSPRLILEQNIGLGFLYPLSKKIIINEMSGIGIASCKLPQVRNGELHDNFRELIFPFLRIGFCYNWGK